MQDIRQGTESTPVANERRACPRARVTSLIYIDIGNVNGGIVTSLSDKGLAFTAAVTLGNGELGTGPVQMRIQFPGAPEALEASGEIVWTSSSGKEACARFVEIGDKAREQICTWVSDHISSNGLRAAPPKLPKMQLPNSQRTKPRGPRFSFAEVASSRVDSTGETGVEDFPGSSAEPMNLPPLEAGAVGFRDGTEAVASAFESPVFTEEQVGKIRPAGNKQTEQAVPGQDSQRQPTLIPERRQHSRRQILLFTYAVLGEDNGGLVFNLSEGGLALTAAAALNEHHFTKMRVRFPDSEDWFETGGRLAWGSDSGKEAGIEFVGLPEHARARIKEWVLQEEPAGETASKEGEGQTSQSGVQALPGFMEPELPLSEPIETPASFEEQPFEDPAFEEHGFEGPERIPAASSPALFKTGIRGIFERASLRRRVAQIQPPQMVDDSVRLAADVTRKALRIAAGAALAVASWMFLQRSFFNKTSGLAARNEPNIQASSQEPSQKPAVAKIEAGADRGTADPPVQPNENASTQTGVTESSVPQTESGTPSPNTSQINEGSQNSGTDRTLKDKLPGEEAQAQMRAASLPPHSVDQSQRPAPSQREQEPKSSQIIASAPARSPESTVGDNRLAEAKSAKSKLADSRPVLTARALPVPDQGLNATTSSVSANSPQLGTAPPVEVEKENPLVTMKQPETPRTRTPVVTVSFDPYPSIRIGKTEKSKKSHQGESLQMGRLLSRVDPAYPEEAKQQGIEGTVRVHAIFNREGGVQSVIPVSGPQLLMPAAMTAVRQWRYSQTILGGQAMETEEDITVLFQLANSASRN